MVHLILGQQIFEMSLTKYLKRFEFKNSNAKDLWEDFTNTAMEIKPSLLSKHDLNIGDIVGSWIDQKALPLVTIHRNYETKRINISQVHIHIIYIRVHTVSRKYYKYSI